MPSETKQKITKPKEEDKPQSERFTETARKLGVDESGQTFEEFANKVMPKKERIKTERVLD